VRDKRELKSINSCKWLIQLKGIHPEVVRNFPGSKNPSVEVTQAMSKFCIVDIISDKSSCVQVEVNHQLQ